MRFEISVFGTPYYGSCGGFISRYCIEEQDRPSDLEWIREYGDASLLPREAEVVREQAERWDDGTVIEVREIEGERRARWYYGIVSIGDAAWMNAAGIEPAT